LKTEARSALIAALDRADKMLVILFGQVVAEQHRRLRLRSEQRKAERAQRGERGGVAG